MVEDVDRFLEEDVEQLLVEVAGVHRQFGIFGVLNLRRDGSRCFDALGHSPSLGLDRWRLFALGFEAFGFEAFGFEAFRFETFRFEAFRFEAFRFEAFRFEAFSFETFGFEAFGFSRIITGSRIGRVSGDHCRQGIIFGWLGGRFLGRARWRRFLANRLGKFIQGQRQVFFRSTRDRLRLVGDDQLQRLFSGAGQAEAAQCILGHRLARFLLGKCVERQQLLNLGLRLGFEMLGFETFRFETFRFEAFRFETFGFEAFGFEAFGFETFGFETFGFETFRFETFRFETFGFETFGFETFGFETFGFETFGFETFGFETFGFETFRF
ncbi:MAG TPA: hypothetical protein VFY12_04815, partial [Arenimonas sp.]|nr:hypothetical protein [Arenimonas sp.]